LSEKASKGRFLKPEKLQNHSNEGKGKEKKKERREGKEGKKNAMPALLVFIIATLESFWPKKKPFHANGLFGDNVVIKNPARYMNHVTVCPSVHIVQRPLFTCKPG